MSVIHLRDAPPGWQQNPAFVYIGRPGRGLSGEFGNEHPVGWCAKCKTAHARGAAIAAHKADATKRFAEDASYRARVESLRGKVLVCFCKPLPCHGDTYVELLRGSYGFR